MASESKIQREIMLALSQADVTVFRNNVAQAWVGEATRLVDGSVLLKNPRPLHAGLAVGSSDLIGIQHGSGRFVAVEVKSQTGRVRPEQKNFIERINEFGGIAGVARSADEAVKLLGE